MTLTEMGRRAKDVSRVLNTLGSREKNMGLEEAARALLDGEEEILTGIRSLTLPAGLKDSIFTIRRAFKSLLLL